MDFSREYYHWLFLIQPAPYLETLIGSAPEAYLRHHMKRFAGLAPFMPDAWPEYVRAFSDPAAINTTCEDYHASATIDLEHDTTDIIAGRKVTSPLLALWGLHGVIERYFDALAEWRQVATDVQGHALPCGYYIPEEVPDLLYDELVTFFTKDNVGN